ncbi:MAG: WYL domain-containing protein [Clostridia bacterium]|nr:WYL domain-containing protein [Clostridia bacterium]
MSMEAKKALIIRIYQVLEDYSDLEHPLKQQDIIDILRREYDIECERKAIGRNISCLKEIGVDIDSDGNGVYLASRRIENSELRLLIDSALCSRYINPTHSKQLIEKLIKLGGHNFKSHVRHVHSVTDWGKTKNKDLFLNIDLIDEAIELGKKIEFDYIRMDIDGKAYVSGSHIGSPYHMLLHNQRYYLMLHDDKYGNICYDRLDKIKNMRILDEDALPLKENAGFEHGINYKNIATGLPYMFSDEQQLITIKCDNFMVDELYDWFGGGFEARKEDDKHFTATVKASPQAMLYWTLQYNDKVEVLSPKSLRKEVIKALKSTLALYGESSD